MSLTDSDKFLVCRNQTPYQLDKENLMADLKDDDLMLVNREVNGSWVPYKATGKQVKDSFEPSPDPDKEPSMSGATLAGGPGFSGRTYTTTLDDYDEGKPAATLTMKAKVIGALEIAGETSPITGVAPNVVTYTATVAPTNISNDPFSDETAQIVCNNSSSSASITFTYPTPADFSSITKIRGGSFSRDVNYTITFTDENGAETSGEGPTGVGYAPTDLPVMPPALVKSFTIQGNDGYAFLGFRNASSEMVVTGSLTDTGSVLTLTDRRDLDNGAFEIGDVVTGYTGSENVSPFKAVLYTGNSGTQTIDVGFSPDLVWMKSTTGAYSHNWYDTVRGATKRILSDKTSAEDTRTGLSAFTANGFTLGDFKNTNDASYDYVAWCWRAGDTTVTNNEGTIESQVRAGNGFSIIKIDMPSITAGDVKSIGHGLGTTPAMWIWKPIDNTDAWYVWHKDFDMDEYLRLNDSVAVVPDNERIWGNTAPSNQFIYTGSTFSSYGNQIIYAWAETDTSSFGKYTGNTSGVTVDCGFEPAFVLIKVISVDTYWVVFDNQRGQGYLHPNTSEAQGTSPYNQVNFTSTGFEIPFSVSSGINGDETYEYIYAAFAGSTTTYDARDANDVAKYGAIETRLNAYPENRKNFRQDIRRSILTSNLTPAEKAFLLAESEDGTVLESGNISVAINAANGSSAYVFSGDVTGDNATINITAGETLTITNNLGAHPLFIKTAAGIGNGSLVTTGVTGQGAMSGSITWDTTGVTPGTYYYQCASHNAMGGQIIVS